MIDRLRETEPNQVYPRKLLIPAAQATVAKGAGLTFTVADVLFTLRRWWWKCTLLGLPLAIAVTAAVWFTFEPTYEASALIAIRSEIISPLASRSLGQNFTSTQLEIIRSPITLNSVAVDPAIAALPEAKQAESVLNWLKQGLRVNYVGQSELCQISFKAKDPVTAAKVANAVLSAYLAVYKDNQNDLTKRAGNLLKDASVDQKDDVDIKRGIVRQKRSKLEELNDADVVLGSQGIRLPSPVTTWESQRTASQFERILKQTKLKAYEEALDGDQFVLAEKDLAMAVEEHPEYQAAKAAKSAAEFKLAQLNQTSAVGKRDASVQVRLNNGAQDVRRTEEDLEKTRIALGPKLREELKKVHLAQARGVIDNLKADIENHNMLELALEAKIAAERTKQEKNEGPLWELELAEADQRSAEALLSLINERIKTSEIELSSLPQAEERVGAAVPEQPLEALPLKKCGIAFAGAFLLPFGLAFGWEKIARRISSADQLASQISLPVLGEVTALPTRWMIAGRRSNDRFTRDRVTFEESIESLRMGLTLAPDLQNMQIVSVTSAISQEGKTSVATALAVSVARCTQELVLLIDADMRAPNIHEMFDISLGPGLAEVLEGSIALDDAIVLKDLGVHVLPAGDLKTSPHVAMKDGAFSALLDQLRNKYRFIIIDSPPVLAASEAMLIAAAADGSLVCTMRDRSRMPQLESACRRLLAAGASLVGCVISGVPTRDWARKYGGYGYGWNRYAEAGARWSPQLPDATQGASPSDGSNGVPDERG